VHGARIGGSCSCADARSSTLLTLTRLEQTFEVVNDVPPPLREPPPAGSVRARRGLPQCSAKHQPEATDA
jgi:hypothetical protein